MSIFTGSGVAIITPFNENGVDYKALDELIEFNIENKTDCIVICGTTGEASTMPDDEHLQCVKHTVEKVNKRVPVIAGSGSNDTEHALYLTQKVKEFGADAALIVTPYYNKTTQKGLYEHFAYLAKNVDIPIMLYNVPSRTGMAISPETAAQLSKIDNIVAIKEASGNISSISKMMALCEGRLDLYSGNDDQIVPLMSLGGKGVVSVVANILPEKTHNIVQKYLDGDTGGSLNLQLDMLEVINSLFCEVNPIPVKEALNLMGFNVGNCRRPLTTMEPSNKDKLILALRNYGFKI